MIMEFLYKIFSLINHKNKIYSRIKIYFIKIDLLYKINKIKYINYNTISDICTFYNNILNFVQMSEFSEKSNVVMNFNNYLLKDMNILSEILINNISETLIFKYSTNETIRFNIIKNDSYKNTVSLTINNSDISTYNTDKSEDIYLKNVTDFIELYKFDSYFKKDLIRLIDNAINLLYYIK